MKQEAAVLDVVAGIYSAALDSDRWSGALTALADLFSGVDATLEVHRRVGDPPLFFAAGSRLPLGGVDDYLSHYARICPRIPYLASLALGNVGYDYDFISERKMDQDAFYSDFLGADDLRYFAAGILINRPGMLGGVYIHRTYKQGHVDEHDLSLLNRLVPHVARALDLDFRLKQSEERAARFDALVEGVSQAMLTLDRRGQLGSANEAAAAILRKNDGLNLRDRRLHCADSLANRQIAAALSDLQKDDLRAGLAAKTQIVAQRPSGRVPYVLTLHRLAGLRSVYEAPDTPATAVFIHDPQSAAEASPSLLAEAFSLTQREAELAAALLKGRSLRAQAESRGVKVSTERSHLKSLMQKTGTRRQADLLRLLAGFTA